MGEKIYMRKILIVGFLTSMILSLLFVLGRKAFEGLSFSAGSFLIFILSLFTLEVVYRILYEPAKKLKIFLFSLLSLLFTLCGAYFVFRMKLNMIFLSSGIFYLVIFTSLVITFHSRRRGEG